jgi:YidC/Oxa1 family membrane protein insertase
MFLFSSDLFTALIVLQKGGEAGVTNFSPQVMNTMMWGLPGISLIFTSFLPASVQVSFLITGILSYLQSAMFRSPWMRSKLNLTTLPTKAKPGEAPPSPYKGTLKTKASPVLTQSELGKRYEGSKSGMSKFQGTTIQTTGQVVEKKSVIGDAVGKVRGQVKDTIGAVMKNGSEVMDTARDTMGGSKEKQLKKEAEAYEKKRREEAAEEMRERGKREARRRERKRKGIRDVE